MKLTVLLNDEEALLFVPPLNVTTLDVPLKACWNIQGNDEPPPDPQSLPVPDTTPLIECKHCVPVMAESVSVPVAVTFATEVMFPEMRVLPWTESCWIGVDVGPTPTNPV